jgi:hypothetical protein
MKRQWPTTCVQKLDGGSLVYTARTGSSIGELENGDGLATCLEVDPARAKGEIVPGARHQRSETEEESRQRSHLQ